MTDIIGTFGTYEAPEKDNKYLPTIKALSEATAENPKASWTVEIDASRESAERLLISKAANEIGHTASFKSVDYSQRTQVGTREKSGNPVYTGVIVATIILVDKHKARRGNGATEAPVEVVEKGKK